MTRRTGRRWSAIALSVVSACILFVVGCTSNTASPTTGSAADQPTGSAVDQPAGATTANPESPGPGPSVPVSVSPGYAEAQTSTSATYSSALPTTPGYSLQPIASTPVPAPGGGDVNQTVAAVPVTTLPAAAISDTADIGQGVSVTITDVKVVTGVARGPGEVGGPAAALTVKVDNGSDTAIPLRSLGITATDNAGTPSTLLSGEPSSPMSGSLDPGQSATGVYVVSIPSEHQNPMQISISYGAGAPTALFVTDVS